MSEPTRNKNPLSLEHTFRDGLLRFIADVNKRFPQYKMTLGEGKRTATRQNWLFKQNTRNRWVTNCDGYKALSMHQYGIAGDLVLVHKKASFIAIWDARVWRTVYAAFNFADYGLELIPQELVHVQKRGSQANFNVSRGRLEPEYVQKHKLPTL